MTDTEQGSSKLKYTEVISSLEKKLVELRRSGPVVSREAWLQSANDIYGWLTKVVKEDQGLVITDRMEKIKIALSPGFKQPVTTLPNILDLLIGFDDELRKQHKIRHLPSKLELSVGCDLNKYVKVIIDIYNEKSNIESFDRFKRTHLSTIEELTLANELFFDVNYAPMCETLIRLRRSAVRQLNLKNRTLFEEKMDAVLDKFKERIPVTDSDRKYKSPHPITELGNVDLDTPNRDSSKVMNSFLVGDGRSTREDVIRDAEIMLRELRSGDDVVAVVNKFSKRMRWLGL